MAGALGFLAGLGQAAMGLPKGLEVAQTEADKAAALAQQQQQFDASRFADVPTEMLPASYRDQAGGAPTRRVPSMLVPFLASTVAEERKRELETQQAAKLAPAIAAIGTPEAQAMAKMASFPGGANEKLIPLFESVLKLKNEAEQRVAGPRALAAILSANGDPAKLAAAFAAIGRPASPAEALPTPGPAQPGPLRLLPTGGLGTSSVLPTVIQQGTQIGAGSAQEPTPELQAATTRVGEAAQRVAQATAFPSQSETRQGVPATAATEGPTGFPGVGWKYEPATGKMEFHSVPPSQHSQIGDEFIKALNQKQAFDEAGIPASDPRYRRVMERMNELKTMIAPPGSGIVERGTMPWNTPGRLTQTPTAGTGGPRVIVPNPPVTPDAEAEKVGLRNSTIIQIEAAANLGETMPQLQTAGGRGSLRIRSYVQGHTPFEALTPEEQAWVTAHDRLRIMYEQSTMGLGPFRSPEMQRQMAEIIGKYWTPGTSTRLRTLADNLRNEGQQVQGAQQAGGQRVLPNPPPRESGPVVRWGRDAQGNPVRLP